MEEKKILGPDGKEIKKPKTVEVDIPEDIKVKIDEKREAKQKLLKEFLNISIERASIVKREQEILDLLKSNADSTNAKIDIAYKKMKLNKDVEYGYRYRPDGKFVGFLKRRKHKNMGELKGYKIIACDYCGRKLITKKWATEKGCRWCDADYHRIKK